MSQVKESMDKNMLDSQSSKQTKLLLLRAAGRRKGILTFEEAKRRMFQMSTLITIRNSKRKMFFFSDDHCFMPSELEEGWVPCTSSIPHNVAPREGLTSGRVSTINDYLLVYLKGYRQITSIDELVMLLTDKVPDEL